VHYFRIIQRTEVNCSNTMVTTS